MMDPDESDEGKILLCDFCLSIDFSKSSLYTEAVVAPHRWDDLPYKPSELSGRFYVYPHHSSIKDLVLAAEKGCHACIQLRHGLWLRRGHESRESRHNGPVELRYYEQEFRTEDNPQELELYVVAKSLHAEVKVAFNFVRYSGQPYTFTDVRCLEDRLARMLIRTGSLGEILRKKAVKSSTRIGSSEDFHLVRHWLGHCLSSHSKCVGPDPKHPPLPTRVLEVNLDEGGSSIKLVSGKGSHGQYVTLSHVWGHARPLKTTRSTLKERMNGIPIDSLPQTFKDTVTVARELPVRYVWIDSLCIIQDSDTDWEIESGKMGDYYRNSLLTIAATSASDGSEGLFKSRSPLELIPCPVKIKLPKSNPASPLKLPISGFFRHAYVEDPSNKTDGFQRPPLWQRAWVLQERLLSPRLLMFSTLQLSWRCRSEEASEHMPEGSSTWIFWGNEDLVLKSLLDRLPRSGHMLEEETPLAAHLNEAKPDLKAIYDAWYDFVMLYGKCDLTFASDVFPAISGIASSISRASGDQYVAGLWKSDLHRGLMWTAPDSTSSRADLRYYRAPSWSWASLPATCSFFVRQMIQDEPDTSCMKVEEAVINIKGANNFGQISSGKLQIMGLLKPAYPFPQDGVTDEIFDAITAHSRNRDSLFDLRKGIGIGRYIPDNSNSMHLTEIWCSPIMTEVRTGPKKNEKQRGAQCLALFPLDRSANIYMRVGFIWIHSFDWFKDCREFSYCIT
jgi:hypothetical protein